MKENEVILLGVGVVALILFTQRWFWLAVFFFSGLAAAFAMIASIIHFQILAALGLFVVMVICFGITAAIAERA